MLNIVKRVENGCTVIAPQGRLDTNTAGELETALQAVVDTAENLVLDFEKLEYISSSGLRVLLSAQKAMAKHGTMKLIHVGDAIMEIFDITGFSEFLTIE